MDRIAELSGVNGVARCGRRKDADLGGRNAEIVASSAETVEGGKGEGYRVGGNRLFSGGAGGELGVIEGDGSALLEDGGENARCWGGEVGD
jgi:hypothetical protein